ncbi:MAG: Lnb N-terminal periplasmic domain-containing protein, partial [Pseudobdellovibrionaceae bacterium]
MGFFLFGFILFFQQKSLAMDSGVLERAQREHWFEDRQWLRLVQYQQTLFGGYKSSGESAKFFLTTEGRTHPDLELAATIRALQENTQRIRSRDGHFEDPVSCVFPARKLWLEKKAGVKFPSAKCERFDRFKEILQPQSLTYVFSSYYLNNPASAFGHTFLRVNKAPSAKDGERYELADYGVGYAAVKSSDNPFVYSFLGVSGLMPGAFDINPYYYKVREYNDFESRDLWEYDLNFNPEEVEMVIAYVWELLDVTFNYHYFTENCSYRILSLFEVARPSLELTDHLKSQVMPADTVQTLFRQQGLIGRIHYRPSVRATFEHRYQGLGEKAQTRLRNFTRDESLLRLTQGLEVSEKRESLDTAMDYLDFRYPQEILKKEGKYFFKKEVLLSRAELGGASE